MVLTAVGLALITILSVWKLKQFKYKVIHETGGAMFYGKWLELNTEAVILQQNRNTHVNKVWPCVYCFWKKKLVERGFDHLQFYLIY